MKIKGLMIVLLFCLGLCVLPAIADDDGDDDGRRWDPTGTYIFQEPEPLCLDPGTLFFSQLIPADNMKRDYLVVQERLNNTAPFDYKTIRGDAWRTGRASFHFTTQLYEVDGASQLYHIWTNSGTMEKLADGTIVVDLYFRLYLPGMDPFEPDQALMVVGPCPMVATGKIEPFPLGED